ncbi:hypothetical protein FKG94_22785 [Exilibacterium tricleocarpae]|uniref:Dynamin N-terminal domain-containing protein n=1 Tax=Exilibacterium tricleocarpae TaxID=2591008 RepID=A0A545SXE1_9GAMM|nr:dynamin family protein [Exilibacterium tricleocarpae]TQV69624.1 hypothetical protein FKG94_22785 [Exilibacterium tricleocarpae]
MDVTSLHRQMAAYDLWKHKLVSQLTRFRGWFGTHGISGMEAQYCIDEALQTLARSSFTLAVVGAYGRGKTTLVNTLLFGQYGQRILPSEPSGSIRCTTEIFCDPSQPSCVRLLPIQTRDSNQSIDRFKCIPHHWLTFNFDPRDPAQARAAMARIAKVKTVTRREADTLGYNSDLLQTCTDNPDRVEIPVWRHALINIDHPLLRKGLRIIDTPGMDALNNEPEMGLHQLARAQALFFVVDAKQGLSKTDRALWQTHLQVFADSPLCTTVALVNKADTLSQQHDAAGEIDNESGGKTHQRPQLGQQAYTLCKQIARDLRLPLGQVCPLSAKQALLGKAAQEAGHLVGSNWNHLEALLANLVQKHQQQLMQDPMLAHVVAVMKNSRNALKQRLFSCDAERERLQATLDSADQLQMITEQRGQAKRIHAQLQRQSLNLRASQRQLERMSQELDECVAGKKLQGQINALQQQIRQSHSPLARFRSLTAFFQIQAQNLDELSQRKKRADSLLETIHTRTLGFEFPIDDDLTPSLKAFDVTQHQQRLMLLKRQIDQSLPVFEGFSTGHDHVGRFIDCLIAQLQDLYSDLQHKITAWACVSLARHHHYTQLQKQLLERHMVLLISLSQTKPTLPQQLQRMRTEIADQEAALFTLDKILDEVNSLPRTALKRSAENSDAFQHPKSA